MESTRVHVKLEGSQNCESFIRYSYYSSLSHTRKHKKKKKPETIRHRADTWYSP
jgi:hypothetical protein